MGWGSGQVRVVMLGGQDGCVRRIEVFAKILFFVWGGGRGQVDGGQGRCERRKFL